MAESVEQLDPTQDFTAEVVEKKAVKGALILTGRNVLLQAISFFSTVLLTIFLLPSEFGTFFLVSAVINFLSYFGDVGFAAALIQKKQSLTNTDLKTVFTSQLILVLFILVVVFIATPYIADFYNLGDAAIYLLWAFAFSLLLSSVKTIPTVLMERGLEFNKWVFPQIVETIVFNTVAVYLAYSGFGVTSFTIAVLLRGILGLIATYIIQPWMPGISISLGSLKSILRFGVPYQINTLLAMVKDDGMILFLGGVLGTSGVGLLGWSQKWAYAPLRFFMDQVIKVTFPAFSRLQDKKRQLQNIVSKSIFFICLLVFPSLTFLVFAAPTLIDIIPKYNKWEPALFALYALTVSSALAAITTPLTNTLNAIGKISLTFRLMIMWTVLTWIFVPFLAIRFGLNGAAIGFTLVGMTSIIALLLISKYVAVDFLQSVGKPFIGALVQGVVLLSIKILFPTPILQIILMGISGLISYLTVMFLLEPNLLNMVKRRFQKREHV